MTKLCVCVSVLEVCVKLWYVRMVCDKVVCVSVCEVIVC